LFQLAYVMLRASHRLPLCSCWQPT